MMGELPPPRLGAQADVQFLVEAAESASRAAPAPVNSDPRFAAHYQNSGRDAPAQAFATLIEGIDKSLGDLLDHLEKLGERWPGEPDLRHRPSHRRDAGETRHRLRPGKCRMTNSE